MASPGNHPGPLKAWRFAPAAVLLAEALLFHRRVLFSSAWTIPWDLRDYHLPLAEFMVGCLRSGELPLWDPYTYCGMPFYANLQTQFAYPPAWMGLLASNLAGGGRLLEFLEWQIALHVFLAGLLAYGLLRRLGLGRGSALFGATVFELGGYFASQAQHLGAMCAAAWLPLAWRAVLDLSQSFRWRRLAALALALAMSLAAGFPAVTIVAFVTSFLLAGALAAFRRGAPQGLLWTAAASLWALPLSAVQLLPALELAGLSTAYSRGEYAGTGGGVPLVGLTSLIVPAHNHIFDLSKYRLEWNPTFLYLYCGLAGLALALVGLLASRSRYRGPLALLTLLAGLWMLGENTLVGRALFTLLPTAVKSPLYAEFAMPAFQLGLAALAALGAQRLIGTRSRWLSAGLVAVTAADLIAAGAGRTMNTFPAAEDPAVSLRQFEGSAETLQRMRTLVGRSLPPARLESYRDSMRWANSAPMIGIPSASGNDPLAPARILDLRRLFGQGQPWLRYWELADLNSPLPDLLNVRYLVTWAPSSEPALEHAKWRRVADLPGHQVYENRSALPRFYLVGRVRPVRSKQEALARLASPEFDPRREAVVEGEAPPGLAGDFSGSVRVLAYAPRRVVLETEASAPAFLVTSESYYPGWRARLDGRPARLRLTNVAFRGLETPAGRHRIEMRFQPVLFWCGLALSVLAAAGLAAAWRRG